jgi:hypothetical protein
LLQLAATALNLLTLPQTDPQGEDDERLPGGEERSELLVEEVSHYFDTLDVRPSIPSHILPASHAKIYTHVVHSIGLAQDIR